MANKNKHTCNNYWSVGCYGNPPKEIKICPECGNTPEGKNLGNLVEELKKEEIPIILNQVGRWFIRTKK